MINFYACLLTIILELIVILFFNKKVELKKIIIVSVFINIITNVLLNLILGCIDKMVIYILMVIILELVVLFGEAIAYNYFIKNKKLSYLLSLSCNACSFIIGSLVLNIFLLLF